MATASRPMGDWMYTLRERFTSDSGERWRGYLAFSLFRNVTEVVTLDSLICPDVIKDLLDDDWKHNIHEDFRTTFFRDSQYLRGRQPIHSSRHQLLAVFELPDGSEAVPPGFVHCGFDIMDSYIGNSTLTNCGPIPEAFAPSIVNDLGLINQRITAIEVRDRMRRLQPDDPHLGACEVWSIARALL